MLPALDAPISPHLPVNLISHDITKESEFLMNAYAMGLSFDNESSESSSGMKRRVNVPPLRAVDADR